MFERSRRRAARQQAAALADLAAQLAADKKFRKRLLKASGHGVRAKRRVWRQLGLLALAGRIAADSELRGELAEMFDDLQAALQRAERKRRRRLRKTLLIVGGAGAAAATALQARDTFGRRLDLSRIAPLGGPRTIQESIEIDTPVSTAYNQWTQFEEFPRFMEGVEEVRQLDDTLLHWGASIGGKRVEWDAKILEQHPDRQISWVSQDGRNTRGTVSFEVLGESRSLISLSMSYKTRGLRESVGSAAAVDRRRVRGDLKRFKELVESRGSESGGWRGDVSAGSASSGTSSGEQNT